MLDISIILDDPSNKQLKFQITISWNFVLFLLIFKTFFISSSL